MTDDEVQLELEIYFIRYSISDFHEIDLMSDQSPHNNVKSSMRDLLQMYRALDTTLYF